MSAATKTDQIKLSLAGEEGEKLRPVDQFKERESREIVIGFSGPIGCGIKSVVEVTEKLLSDRRPPCFQ